MTAVLHWAYHFWCSCVVCGMHILETKTVRWAWANILVCMTTQPIIIFELRNCITINHHKIAGVKVERVKCVKLIINYPWWDSLSVCWVKTIASGFGVFPKKNLSSCGFPFEQHTTQLSWNLCSREHWDLHRTGTGTQCVLSPFLIESYLQLYYGL